MFKEFADSWGWFSEKEMSRIEKVSPAETARMNALGAEIIAASKEHGGLQEYMLFLQEEKDRKAENFRKCVESVMPLLPQDGLTWQLETHRLIAHDQYGNEAVTASFNTLHRLIAKGKTLIQAIEWHI